MNASPYLEWYYIETDEFVGQIKLVNMSVQQSRRLVELPYCGTPLQRCRACSKQEDREPAPAAETGTEIGEGETKQ